MPKLPIEDMTEQQFVQFKKKCLDKDKLTPEDIDEIFILFGGDRPDMGYLDCKDPNKEVHPHSYPCRHYYNPAKGIVDRLITEIARLQKLLDKKEK